MRRLRHFHFRHRFGGDHLASLDGTVQFLFLFFQSIHYLRNKKKTSSHNKTTNDVFFSSQTAKESKWRKAVATSTTIRRSRKAFAMHLSSMLIMNDDGWKDGAD
jgi:hypothetical protein